MQRGELIGSELEEIFDAADLSNPEASKPFQRRPVVLPKMSEDWTEHAPVIAAPLAAAAASGQGSTKTTA